MVTGPEASIVIPTRNRPDDLRRCLAALARQETARELEVVVVDDGSDPPVDVAGGGAGRPSFRVVRTGGVGPGPARNAGIAAARAPLVLFTDDDTEPAAGWVEEACRFLEEHPGHVGVEGPVESPPFDYLSELSLVNDIPGAYWTCNVGYRRVALERLGGFSTEFPYPHCEDRDLGYRALALGPIGWADGMRVVHRPRPLALGANAARMRYTASEVLLFERHRDRIGGRARALPPRLFPIVHVVLLWAGRARRERRELVARPRRLLRFVTVAALQTGLITVFALSGPRRGRRYA